jgi:hypothetical protein
MVLTEIMTDDKLIAPCSQDRRCDVTVAVACNTPEGVILGTDSTITLSDEQGRVLKTYDNATKIFQVGKKPVGIATYGAGSIGNRVIGTYVREFERQNPHLIITKKADVKDIVEELRNFFSQQYINTVIPLLEAKFNKTFDEIPRKDKPTLGMAVGGFSSGAYLSEIWNIQFPEHLTPNSALLMTGQGDFRSSWYALKEPIIRYHRGHDDDTLKEIIDFFIGARGTPLTTQESDTIKTLLLRHEYQIPISAMPLLEAIGYVKFLVEMVINHYRFAVGAPVVGGRVQLGLVSYRGKNFRILSPSEISYGLAEGEIEEIS